MWDLQRIRDSVDLVDVMVRLGHPVGDRVTHQIHCPFHVDEHPSARLYVKNGRGQAIFCWTCGKNYDAIEAVQTLMGVNFHAAVQWLVDRYDIKLVSLDITMLQLLGNKPNITRKERRGLKGKASDEFVEHCKRFIYRSEFLQHVIDCCFAELDEINDINFDKANIWLGMAKNVSDWANKQGLTVASFMVEDLECGEN